MTGVVSHRCMHVLGHSSVILKKRFYVGLGPYIIKIFSFSYYKLRGGIFNNFGNVASFEKFGDTTWTKVLEGPIW